MNTSKRLVLGAFAVFALLLTLSGAFGFSTLGLSNVDFSSNDPQLNAPAWLLTVVENGNDQYAVGTFTPSQITRPSDGAPANQTLKLEITNTQNTCQYSFQNQYVPVYAIQQQVAPSNGVFDWSWVNTQQKCQALPGYVGWSAPGFTGYCFIETQSASITPLGTPTNVVTSTITATANGQAVSGTVTNTGQRSVNLGSQAYAAWQGNLVSGSQCPNPLDTGVMGASVNGQLIITNKAAYDAYTPALAQFQACINGIGTGADPATCVSTYNNLANAAVQTTTNPVFSQAAIGKDGSGNGQATITEPNLLQYPVISMRVRADWLGIVVPVGKPQIISVTSSPFTQASTGNIRAVVKNIGTGHGTFTVSAQCQAPAAQAGIAQTLNLDPGMTGYADIPITGQAGTSQQTASCTVTAADVNQPANTATQTVTVTVNPITICQPTTQRCVNNRIQQCDQTGASWIDEQLCSNGCTVSNGVPVCQNAEVCTTDAQCDDHDPTTVDSCVGVVVKQCQHVVIPPGGAGFNWGKYGLLIFWAMLAIVSGVLGTILGRNVHPAWYGLHLVTVVSAFGAFIGVFALFGTLAAILASVGLILLLAGVGIGAVGFLGPGIAAGMVGFACIIIALLLTFVTLPGWLAWL